MTQFASLLAALALAGTCGLSHAQVSAKDGVLVGPNGHTLYVFDNDQADCGKSACNGACATNWPPLLATTAPSGDGYSMVQRDDGMGQVASKGKPLYYWAKDTKPGDRTGDGVNKVWHAAKP